MSAADEVRRGLGGAADAGELHEILRLERHAPAGLCNRRGDGIVTAARAERRHGPFIVAAREAELVLWQRSDAAIFGFSR